jgi:hypothetical protein
MTHLLSRRGAILLMMLIPLLVSLACITILGDDSQADSQASDDELIVQTDMVFGPGDFILPETKAGLSELSSYKATLVMSFEGTREGSRQQWSKTYVMLVSTGPRARQLEVEKTGDISDPYPVLMAEADGAAYERVGENACSANVIEPENSLAENWEPAGFLSGVHGAEQAGSETVNNVAADHYTFDERALGQLDIAKSTGEMWVASDGGYLVKYILTTTGNAEYFGEGIEGTLTWDYELTEINQPLTIELPDDCPAGMVDAPQLPDASNVLNMPGVLSYDTASSLTDAAAFYQKQIPDLGWLLVGEPAITDTTALMDFTEGNQTMTVIIIVGDTGTNVQILLEKAQE